jgi:hypothetical protein
MVNYQDPNTIAREFSAYTFSVCFSSFAAQLSFLNFEQRRFWVSIMFSLVFICESLLTLPRYTSMLDLIAQARHFASRWELVTTLDYEWDIIRGRRPYRWTIWVCDVSVLRHYYLPATEN